MLSIIICTRDRSGPLAETLAALQQVEIPAGESAELVLVNNGSTDRTADVMRGFTWRHGAVRVVDEPRRGKGYAYNRGIATASGDILVLTDDDVRPPAQWLAVVTEPIRSGRADVVAGGVIVPAHLQRRWMTPVLRAMLASTESLAASKPQWVVAANMAFRRDVLKQVPAFDTELGPGALGFEDEVLFAWQAEVAGLRVVGAFDAPVEHWFDVSRLSRRAMLESARASGRSKAYIDYHWEQRDVTHAGHARLGAAARLLAFRLSHPFAWRKVEGVSEEEVELVRAAAYWAQCVVERQRPRAYAYRGLVKSWVAT